MLSNGIASLMGGRTTGQIGITADRFEPALDLDKRVFGLLALLVSLPGVMLI